MTQGRQRLLPIARAATLLLLVGSSAPWAQTPQQHVHHMAPQVMPFDLAQTTHFFRMTDDGGVQRVLVKAPAAAEQIALVQQHLEHEARAFQRGDYGDPAALHGAEMPGLKELQAGARQIDVSYQALPDGGEIRFATRSRSLSTAIHRWFGAQLSEHGADAVAQ